MHINNSLQKQTISSIFCIGQLQYSCNELFYDKTKVLNGLKVVGQAVVRPDVSVEIGTAYNISSLDDKLTIFDSRSFKEIFIALNVTPVIYFFNSGNQKNENDTSDYFIKNLVDGIIDITLNCFLYNVIIDNITSYSSLYPRISGTYVILTHHKKIISSLDQLGSIFHTEIIILTALVFLITFAVILLSKKADFGTGILEIFRLILSASTVLKVYRLSLKIFVTFIIFFVIILNAYYQGHVSAYTTQMNREIIHTITDLQNLKYSIFVTPYISHVIGVNSWTNEQKKYVHLLLDSCPRLFSLINESNSACIEVARLFLPIATKYNLHAAIIRNSGLESPLFRSDWPVNTQVNIIMSRLSEGGFFYYWESINVDHSFDKIKCKEIEIFDGYREVILSDLYHAFLLFATFIAISFVVFVMEIIVPKLRTSTILIQFNRKNKRGTLNI